jgi:Ca2+-binding EF-hand superfamily protein
MLFWELQNHVELLAPMAVAFKRVDTERRGTCNKAQFLAFCKLLNSEMPRQEAEQLYAELDPLGNQQATFSSIVHHIVNAAEPEGSDLAE